MKLVGSRWFLICATVFLAGLLIVQTISIPVFSGMHQFELVGFSNGTMKVNTILKIRNNNWFSYSGNNLKFDIYYKDHLVAKGTSNESFRFEKKSESLFLLNADFFMDSLFNELKSILYKDSVPMKVAVSGRFTFLNINSSNNFETWLNTKDLVDALVEKSMGDDGLKMESIHLKEVTLSTTFLNVGFQIKNNLPFEMFCKEIRGSIYADPALKIKVSTWNFPARIRLSKKDSDLIEGIVNVNNTNSALSAMSKALNGSLDYFLVGHALVSVDGREIKIPLRQHFKVYPLTQEIVVLNNLR